MHYERKTKKLSTLNTKVWALTFVKVLTDDHVISIPEGHITTHGRSTPVNDAHLPYDVHLFRPVDWFDAIKDDDGFSTNVRLPDSFQRTCAEAVTHVGRHSIDVATDATKEYVEWDSNNDWPDAVILSEVERVEVKVADDSPEVIDLASERIWETHSAQPTNALAQDRP